MSVPALTPKELKLIEHLTCGLGNKEIASLYGMSEQTVKNSFRHMFDKIGVDTRVQLLVWWYEKGRELYPKQA